MKNLLLVRHAKSSWKEPHLEDHERPLNARGKRDGSFMPGYIRNRKLIPDFIMSSHAERAHRTAQYFADEFKDNIQAFEVCRDLYFGSLEDWMYEINSLGEHIKFPAFFSHNPNITYLTNNFTDEKIDNVPTCGVIHLISEADQWADLDFDNTNVAGLHFPKLLIR
jgi:phosphohistidine phosphatase